MKVSYSPIIEAHERNCRDLVDILHPNTSSMSIYMADIDFIMQLAMEAEEKEEKDEAVKDISNDAKPTNNDEKESTSGIGKDDQSKAVDASVKRSKLIAKINAVLEKIKQIIAEVTKFLQNRGRLFLENSKGFSKDYYHEKSIVKPKDEITVMCYGYANAVIDNVFDRLINDFKLIVDFIANEGSGVERTMPQRVEQVVNADGKGMMEAFFEPYSKDAEEPIKTASEFNKYILNKFRGEKQERTFSVSQIPVLEKRALSEDYIRKGNNYLQVVNASNVKAKTLLRSAQRTTTNTEEDKKEASSYISKLALLFNDITFLIRCYMEWNLEEALNYRAVLKRFYNM